jgi:hypothetical protein
MAPAAGGVHSRDFLDHVNANDYSGHEGIAGGWFVWSSVSWRRAGLVYGAGEGVLLVGRDRRCLA